MKNVLSREKCGINQGEDLHLDLGNMKYILLLLFLPVYLFSQSSLSGSIKDQSGYPIMGANVIAVNNETSVLDGFGISNENGYFSINLKNGTEFNIKITFIGFKPIEFNTTLSDDTVKDFVLEEQSEALDAVEIVYEMPVEIRGDTIVYSADAFNTGTEKKLADVLKNLPGVEVNEDGRIEVEGQEVRKIQIEGKTFLMVIRNWHPKICPQRQLERLKF